MYKNENNSEEFYVYIPCMLNGYNIEDASVFLKIMLPDNTGFSVPMTYIMTDNEYCVYKVLFDNNMTCQVGDLIISITIIFGNKNNTIIKTSETQIHVLESISSDDILDEGNVDQVDWLTSYVLELDNNKADNLSLNNNTNQIQLTANGNKIGDPITIPTSFDDNIIIFGNS